LRDSSRWRPNLSESLHGVRVALLEARRESELASLVRRHGGEPVCVPALREVERDCTESASRAIDATLREGAVVVLATGVGLARWLAIADSLKRGVDLRRALGSAKVVCRGPKPVAVLKREGLVAHVRAPAPHTTRELLDVLDGLDVRDHDVVFVHDGGGARTVPEALVLRGARLVEVQPYAWSLPEDLSALRSLVTRLAAGQVEAIAFTTQVQARHLFSVADAMGSREALAEALRSRVTVAAVGPTTASTLAELGAPPHVVPAQSNMGAMVLALAKRMNLTP
jgi:uroporphyrinogen-III synthase